MLLGDVLLGKIKMDYSKIQNLNAALIYLRDRQESLFNVYNALFDASEVTGLGVKCLMTLKEELNDIIDVIFILEKYEEGLKDLNKND